MTKLKEYTALIIPIAVAIVLCIYAYGCEPKTRSLLDPRNQVTGLELKMEMESLIAQLQLREIDLERKMYIRDIILQQGLIITQTGAVNPIGIITSILAILGVTATVDDIRLRKKINANRNA